jgi:hypothetical protein
MYCLPQTTDRLESVQKIERARIRDPNPAEIGQFEDKQRVQTITFPAAHLLRLNFGTDLNPQLKARF